MKKAAGFITGDGTFFEDEKEAALHEAEWRLRSKLSVEFPDLKQDNFMVIVITAMKEIGEYINAFEAANPTERALAEDEIGGEVKSEQAKIGDGLGHVSSTEEDLTSLLQLPARGSEHVPNVGSRTRTEKILDRRKKHGA